MTYFFPIISCVFFLLWIFREWRSRAQIHEVCRLLSEVEEGRKPVVSKQLREGSKIGSVIEAVHEKTALLRRQQRLSDANLEIILSSILEGVIVADEKRRVRLMNPTARRIFSASASMLGMPVVEVVKEPAVDNMIAEALQSEATQEREIEVGLSRAPMCLAVRVAPMRDASGNLGVLVMCRDVTRLSQLEKMRREFVANVSHELRTPLAIFQGYVENLQDCPEMTREEQADVFSVLERHSKRLNALVEDLLVLARLESRNEKLDLAPLNLESFFAEIAQDWAHRMKQRGVKLKMELPAHLPMACVDRMRMEQVFTNLLDNALKYTPADGVITIGAGQADGMMEMWVKDTGQGILSTDLPHIFERFYRADKARSREIGGTGLGLSIVKHIAQAHGGSVNAESLYGRGTTIRLRLPI